MPLHEQRLPVVSFAAVDGQGKVAEANQNGSFRRGLKVPTVDEGERNVGQIAAGDRRANGLTAGERAIFATDGNRDEARARNSRRTEERHHVTCGCQQNPILVLLHPVEVGAPLILAFIKHQHLKRLVRDFAFAHVPVDDGLGIIGGDIGQSARALARGHVDQQTEPGVPQLMEVDGPEQGLEGVALCSDLLTERFHARRQRDGRRLPVHHVHHRGDGVLHEVVEHGPLEIGFIGLVARGIGVLHTISHHARRGGQVKRATFLDLALAIEGVSHLGPVFQILFVVGVFGVDAHGGFPQ